MDNFIGALWFCLQFPEAAIILSNRKVLIVRHSEKPRQQNPGPVLKHKMAMGGMKMRSGSIHAMCHYYTCSSRLDEVIVPAEWGAEKSRGANRMGCVSPA